MWWSWKNDDLQGQLEAWHNDVSGLQELKKKLRRGDFTERNETWRIKRWIWKRTRELRTEFLNSPEGAGNKAASAAWVSAWSAVIAVLLSLVAVWFSWLAYAKPDSIQRVKLEPGVTLTLEKSGCKLANDIQK
jgi:hypothetical protein